MRKYNYYTIKSVKNFLDLSKENIYLFSHVNECNSTENRIIKDYFTANKINSVQIRSNLIKRLNIHPVFFPLYKGPTQIIKFETIESFYFFLDNNYVKNKFLPLLIYWNNKIYSPNWFYSYLKKKLAISQDEKLDKIGWLKSSLNLLQLNLVQTIKILNFTKLLLLFSEIQKKKSN